MSNTIRVTLPSGLTAEDSSRWDAMRTANNELSSPFFSRELCLLASEARTGIEVAVFHEGNNPVGFLPFHRDPDDVGSPYLGSFTDCQGIIASRQIPQSAADFLTQTGLRAFRFDHWVSSQSMWEPYSWARSPAFYIDISGGFDAYQRSRSGETNEVREALRKGRKLEKDFGDVKFQWHDPRSESLSLLIHWKEEQLAAAKQLNCFAPTWVRPLMTQIATSDLKNLRGIVSTIEVRGELVAASLSLARGGIVHGLITAFNRAFSRYSPGRLLIIRMAETAQKHAVHRIDMGMGDETFKRSLATHRVDLAEGTIDRDVMSGWWNWAKIRAKTWLRATPAGVPVSRLVRRLRYVTSGAPHDSAKGNRR